MIGRTFALLLGLLATAGCTVGGPGYGGPVQLGGQPGAGRPGAQGPVVAILLPLTGQRAEIGATLQHAAELALAAPGSPRLDVRDTAGTPQGAAAAAQAAVAEGAGMILGPLTSAETASVAPIAVQAGVPVLAFTNDTAQAQPGVWPLGITPRQQVVRLVAAAHGQGKVAFAALLPENDFGRAMAAALDETVTATGLEPARIRQYAKGMASITDAARALSDYDARGGALDERIRAARASGDAAGRKEAADLASQRAAVPPPPFDALLLADTGEGAAAIASLLPYYDVRPPTVRILGPALWADPSSGSGQFPGAWYAAPDPAARAVFAQAYAAKYGTQPRAIGDLAYDAASIARVAAQSGGFSAANLTQPAGFTGADGLLSLGPDGRVRRALAVFAIGQGGPQLVEPPPQSVTDPGV